MSVPQKLNLKQLITLFPQATYNDAVTHMGLVSKKTMENLGMTREQILGVYKKFNNEKSIVEKEIDADKARTKMFEKLKDTTKLQGAIADSKIKDNNDFMKSYHEMKAEEEDADREFLSNNEEEFAKMDGGKNRKRSCRRKKFSKRKRSTRRKRLHK
jgi:hypothetical protein